MRYPVVEDLDGDGRPDLALPYTSKPNVQDAVRVVARGEVMLKVPLFLNRGGAAPIARLANRQLEIGVPVALHGERGRTVRPGQDHLTGRQVLHGSFHSQRSHHQARQPASMASLSVASASSRRPCRA